MMIQNQNPQLDSHRFPSSLPQSSLYFDFSEVTHPSSKCSNDQNCSDPNLLRLHDHQQGGTQSNEQLEIVYDFGNLKDLLHFYK
jgi:hypothetical protein